METMVGLVLISPVVLAVAPRRWAFLAVAFQVLGWGWTWLTLRGERWNESNYHGFDVMLLFAWAVIIAVGWAAVFVRPWILRSWYYGWPEFRPHRFPLWPIPLAVLASIFFMHWLSNRLAGVSPARWAHALVAAAGVLVAAAFLAARVWWKKTPNILVIAGMTFGIGMAGWVGLGARDAVQAAVTAERVASGSRYCLLTFTSRDRPRPAESVFELSRLVSRSGGRDYMEDAHWLVVETPAGLVAKHRDSWSGRYRFRDISLASAPCVPRVGGNLAGPLTPRSAHRSSR